MTFVPDRFFRLGTKVIFQGDMRNVMYAYSAPKQEVNFQFWKLFAVVLDTHIKCVDKIHKRIDPTLVMLPLN